jgi:hypothetical protein
MWEEDDTYENGFDDGRNWEIRIDNKTLEYFEEKEESINYLIESIDSLTDELFLKNLSLIGYENENELFDIFMEMCEMDFYDLIENIKDNFDIKVNYSLINRDGDEPEFGEL